MADPRPILVLGVNRSGTKWLCNEIGRHPDVAVVAHRDHGGVLESNLLTEFGQGFVFEDAAGYEAFLDFWTRTHFFALAGGRREAFETKTRPTGPVEAFRMLMDDYARRQGAAFWVQKVGPFNAATVLERIPEAKVVVIYRDLVDTVRSRLKLDRNRGFETSAFRAALSIAIQMREVDGVCGQRDVLCIRYENLRDNREQTLSEIAGFLGLRDAPWRNHEFPRNTSFRTEGERDKVMSMRDHVAVRVVQAFVPLVPQALLRRVRDTLTRATAEVLPGTFRHLESEGQPEVSRS